MTMHVVGFAGLVQHKLDRIEGLAQRLVTDRVDGELKALRMSIGCFGLEIGGIVDADAARPGFVGVRFGEQRGLRAQ